jgi:hypothetical protein
VHTSAVCVRAGQPCSCVSGKLISQVIGSCSVTSDTGPCSQGAENPPGSCCVCSP